jgi:transcriptional regulator of met regulon
LYTKKSEVPSMWKNLGQSHPSFRFSIGDRIETDLKILSADLRSINDNLGHTKWIPGTIRGFNANNGTYDILLDYPVGKCGRDAVRRDLNDLTRPFGFTKSATHLTDPCATCGLNEPTEGIVTILQCGDCRRTRYCTTTCQRKDWKKHRVLCHAIVAQNERVSMEIKELVKTGKSEALDDALMDAVQAGDLKIIRKLMKKRGDDINVNYTRVCEVTPIYIASQNGNVAMLKVLLEAGGNVNLAESVYNNTPLSIASFNGHVNTVKILIEAGAVVNHVSTDGATSLFDACQQNHSSIVELLLHHLPYPNIDVNLPMTREQSYGATPLIIASYLGNYECVQQLLQQSTINTTSTFQNKTALQWSQPNERAHGWEFLKKKINTEGRKKIQSLF